MWQQTKFVSHSYKNVEKIFPLKQHTVEELIEHCKAHYPSITRIVIFGSSVTPACNPWSDLDVYLEGIGRSEGFVPPQNDAYDIWYESDVTPEDPLFSEIRTKGVVVYGADFALHGKGAIQNL